MSRKPIDPVNHFRNAVWHIQRLGSEDLELKRLLITALRQSIQMDSNFPPPNGKKPNPPEIASPSEIKNNAPKLSFDTLIAHRVILIRQEACEFLRHCKVPRRDQELMACIANDRYKTLFNRDISKRNKKCYVYTYAEALHLAEWYFTNLVIPSDLESILNATTTSS
ncbi:MAG: hypothetical protein N4J56_007300 [Chroococcidiopsis sp. SAG 2025]|uniref:hypothetical protein n=1 Tax=Chroococcidiopsis sp. SAG 2025 TaxID=171389 RepID=UPI0029373EA2|nr:hypothetical protein [Chroococcidiopsis sp. SAG 2025]MDV2997595.1 hypothetical protein [Chroococcidiopsis sp. SAG 2025]